MRQLHLTRALLAAGITLAVCASLPFILYVVKAIIATRALPTIVGTREYVIYIQPLIISSFGWLLVILSVPVAVLWCVAGSRRTLSVPWMAAICGGGLAILLSPAWYVAVILTERRTGDLTVMDYLDHLHLIVPYAAVTGALYFFLHSFFIRQALGKKAWLETRA